MRKTTFLKGWASRGSLLMAVTMLTRMNLIRTTVITIEIAANLFTASLFIRAISKFFG